MKFYKQKKDTYIRNYDGTGYICSTGIWNDRVVNNSGTVFLTALSREPQSLDYLVDKIYPEFVDVDREVIKNDAREFYDILVTDGFLLSGETAEQINSQEVGFSYKSITPESRKADRSPVISRADSDTQITLESFFQSHPHLTSFQIELTSRCNERCVHCYIPHELKLKDISSELYYDVLKQLSKMGVLYVTLSGGEPMLHPNFVEFLLAAKKYDFYVNVLSNLTLINDEIIGALKEGNVTSVQVSLYSMDPERHDAITTRKGSFEKTKNAILRLIENDIPVHVSCPTMKGNKDDYGEVLAWCSEHKIRCQTDYIMMAEYNHDTANLANRLSIEETAKVIEDIINGDEDYQRAISYRGFEEVCKSTCFNPDRRLCGVGISSCAMVSNGNVYPCPGWQDYIIGNLTKNTLEEIWASSQKIQYLRGLTMKDLGNGKCCKCENAAFCSPCLVRNANESPTGDPLEINSHFCKVAKLNKDIVLKWRKEHNCE